MRDVRVDLLGVAREKYESPLRGTRAKEIC